MTRAITNGVLEDLTPEQEAEHIAAYTKTPEQLAATANKKHWSAIQSIRDTKTQQGGFFAEGKWFHSDANSRIQQLGLVMMGANIPVGLQWKTLDGTFVTMTPTLAGQIFMSAAQQDAAIFAHAEVLKAQGLGADINAGWPVTYGG